MFIPQEVFIEERAMSYEIGKNIERFCQKRGFQPVYAKSARVKLHGASPAEKYRYGKGLLVAGIWKGSSFQSCKPSAHYQLPLVSGCMGMCEYCYLNTRMGKRPYVKVYANLEEILARADRYMEERAPETTVFEGAATSDPLPLEPYTQSLAKTILHFSKSRWGRFRFVSKFDDVESLLPLAHNGRTEVRISLNIDDVIRQFEHRTPVFKRRLAALKRLAAAGYPTGILLAPVFWNEKNRPLYAELLKEIGEALQGVQPTFEVISHRFTAAAKNNIMDIFPDTLLPLAEEERKYQYGQFGYGKYVYPPESMLAYKEFFRAEISRYFPEEQIYYII